MYTQGGMYMPASMPYPNDLKCSAHFTRLEAKFRKKAGVLSLRIQSEYHQSERRSKAKA